MKKLIWIILGLIIALFTVTKLISESAEVNINHVADALNDFNFDLNRKLASQADTNMVSSPYSLSSLLSLCALGAAGDTRNELLNILHLDDTAGISGALDKINFSWLGAGQSSLANALWGAKNFTYEEPFLKVMRQSKYNHFYTIDYAKNPEAARQTINQWVEKNTQDYIKDLLPQGVITPDTSLVLVNAIYFKGKWKSPFDQSFTQSEPFTNLDGKTVKTAMMHQSRDYAYSESNVIRMLQLPYGNGEIAMAVLLPNGSHTIADIKNALNNSVFSELLATANYQEVILQLPKFKIESTFDTLKDTLISMGLTTAFSQKADFSNMVKGPLRFTDAVQKAVIEVDEQGTVAAAATGMVATLAMAQPSKPPIQFIVNQPFVFIIFDTGSKIILFVGQVTGF